MAGISDKALKTNYAENKSRYNDGNELQNKEFTDGSGLETYDATFRMYDPQIGRFWQIDPLAEASDNWSPYAYAQDNPVFYNDPLGLDTATLATATVTPDQNAGVRRANTRGAVPNVTAGAAPSTASALPIDGNSNSTAGAEPLPSQPYSPDNPLRIVRDPEPGPKPFPVIVPGVAGTTIMTVGGVLIPLSTGQEGIRAPNPMFSPQLPDSKPDQNGDVTLYRGVNPSNPNFKYALDGWAVPLGLDGGHNDPARHNGGDTHSIFTSWTFRPSVALKFAGQYGVVLVQRFKLSSLFPSPDAFKEQEILVPGVIKAQVYNSWTWKNL